jgi:ribonuclease III
VVTTQGDRQSKPSRPGFGLEALGIPPEGGAIYDLAFTHRSFAFEQSEQVDHNERLEFLGDAILGAVVTTLIFNTYPDLTEGEMARLRSSVVNTAALAEVARSVDLGSSIRLGRGEEASGGPEKPSLLADTFEAVVGAVYLDRGIDVVTEVLERLFRDPLDEAMGTGERYDAKTALQEEVVHDLGMLPRYRIASTGPDHAKRFSAEVYAGSDLLGQGRGNSKKEAEQDAARRALRLLSKRGRNGAGGSEPRRWPEADEGREEDEGEL